MDNETIIHTVIGISVTVIGFVVTGAIGIVFYFLRKRDNVVEFQGNIINAHGDRLTKVETKVEAMASDVSEIHEDVKAVRGDTANIRGAVDIMKTLLEQKIK